MDEFLEGAFRIRAALEGWIDNLFKLPFDAFLDAGREGIHQIYLKEITRECATFADHITAPGLYVPKEVIKAMCLGAAHVGAAIDAQKNGHSYSFAFSFLTRAAEEVGFCRGAGFGVIHEDDRSRAALSIHGAKGALTLHGPRTELKSWALSQAASYRGSDKDIARKLAAQIPKHLEDASKDPQRLIYDALRAAAKPN
jgi:hypothetical protein